METASTSETVIRPDRSWWGIDWREIAEYRDLLWLLVKRDFVAKYKQTVLGPVWFILQPLLTTLVFTVIFGKVAKIPTGGVPPVLFYLCGLLGWNYFSQTFTAVAGTFTSNAQLFGKVYFPRLIVPISLSISGIWAFLLNLAMFAGFLIWFSASGSFNVSLGLDLLTIPLLILNTAAVAVGAGLWMAVLTAKYRDFTHLTGFITQMLLYATPVIYPLSEISEKWQWLASLNPMAAPIEMLRIVLLCSGKVTTTHYATSLSLTLVLLASGLIAFNRSQRTAIDTI